MIIEVIVIRTKLFILVVYNLSGDIIMHTAITYFIFGVIIGYIIMYMTANLIVYHGPNSNKVRNKKFKYKGETYAFIPKIQSS